MVLAIIVITNTNMVGIIVAGRRLPLRSPRPCSPARNGVHAAGGTLRRVVILCSLPFLCVGFAINQGHVLVSHGGFHDRDSLLQTHTRRGSTQFGQPQTVEFDMFLYWVIITSLSNSSP